MIPIRGALFPIGRNENLLKHEMHHRLVTHIRPTTMDPMRRIGLLIPAVRTHIATFLITEQQEEMLAVALR